MQDVTPTFIPTTRGINNGLLLRAYQQMYKCECLLKEGDVTATPFLLLSCSTSQLQDDG